MSTDPERHTRRSAKSGVEGKAAAGEGSSTNTTNALAFIEKTAGRRLGLVDVETREVLALPDITMLPSVERAYMLIVPLRDALAAGRKYIGALTDLALRDLDSRGATERRINGVLYKRESDGEWAVDSALMFNALMALVPDELTEQEVEEAVLKTITVEYKPSNSVLNKLAKRGGVVAETIAKFRRRNEGNPRIVRAE